MIAFTHWFLHVTGADNASGAWYLWWSGFGSDLGELTIVASIALWARHRNCVTRGCWRLGHPDPDHGHPVCRRHSPKVSDR